MPALPNVSLTLGLVAVGLIAGTATLDSHFVHRLQQKQATARIAQAFEASLWIPYLDKSLAASMQPAREDRDPAAKFLLPEPSITVERQLGPARSELLRFVTTTLAQR